MLNTNQLLTIEEVEAHYKDKSGYKGLKKVFPVNNGTAIVFIEGDKWNDSYYRVVYKRQYLKGDIFRDTTVGTETLNGALALSLAIGQGESINDLNFYSEVNSILDFPTQDDFDDESLDTQNMDNESILEHLVENCRYSEADDKGTIKRALMRIVKQGEE